MAMDLKVRLIFSAALFFSQTTAYVQRNGTGVEYNLPEGGSKALNCSLTEAPSLETWQNVTWVLPDLTLMQRGSMHNLVSGTRFTLSEDGQILLVENIQPSWYGEYYCMVLYNMHETHQFYITRFGINTSYYYAAELWNEYRDMIIILGVASGTTLALLTLLFSLIIWCRRSSRRRNTEPPLVPDTSRRQTSVWQEYLGGQDGTVFPGSDKTL